MFHLSCGTTGHKIDTILRELPPCRGLQLSSPRCFAICKIWSREPSTNRRVVPAYHLRHSRPMPVASIIVQNRDIFSKLPICNPAPLRPELEPFSCICSTTRWFHWCKNGVPCLIPINVPHYLTQKLTALHIKFPKFRLLQFALI